MYKWFILAGSFLNGYLAFDYMINNRMPHKFLIVSWGIFVALELLVSTLNMFFMEKALRKAKERYKDLIKPIQNNINLTDEEKKARIQEVLKQDLQNQLKTFQGEQK